MRNNNTFQTLTRLYEKLLTTLGKAREQELTTRMMEAEYTKMGERADWYSRMIRDKERVDKLIDDKEHYETVLLPEAF